MTFSCAAVGADAGNADVAYSFLGMPCMFVPMPGGDAGVAAVVPRTIVCDAAAYYPDITE